MYLVSPIVYLESKDFTNSGTLKHFKNKTCVIMIQANYCGHCTSAKPLFQKFADKSRPPAEKSRAAEAALLAGVKIIPTGRTAWE